MELYAQPHKMEKIVKFASGRGAGGTYIVLFMLKKHKRDTFNESRIRYLWRGIYKNKFISVREAILVVEVNFCQNNS